MQMGKQYKNIMYKNDSKKEVKKDVILAIVFATMTLVALSFGIFILVQTHLKVGNANAIGIISLIGAGIYGFVTADHIKISSKLN